MVCNSNEDMNKKFFHKCYIILYYIIFFVVSNIRI